MFYEAVLSGLVILFGATLWLLSIPVFRRLYRTHSAIKSFLITAILLVIGLALLLSPILLIHGYTLEYSKEKYQGTAAPIPLDKDDIYTIVPSGSDPVSWHDGYYYVVVETENSSDGVGELMFYKINRWNIDREESDRNPNYVEVKDGRVFFLR